MSECGQFVKVTGIKDLFKCKTVHERDEIVSHCHSMIDFTVDFTSIIEDVNFRKAEISNGFTEAMKQVLKCNKEPVSYKFTGS